MSATTIKMPFVAPIAIPVAAPISNLMPRQALTDLRLAWVVFGFSLLLPAMGNLAGWKLFLASFLAIPMMTLGHFESVESLIYVVMNLALLASPLLLFPRFRQGRLLKFVGSIGAQGAAVVLVGAIVMQMMVTLGAEKSTHMTGLPQVGFYLWGAALALVGLGARQIKAAAGK